MSVKLERKERSHETILASAGRLLRERGIAGARIADVMQGAGLTVGGFYAHFGSKEDLVRETLRRLGAEHRARLFANLEDKPEADRAEVVLKRYLSAAHRDAPEEGCPFPAVVGEVATSAPEHREALAGEVDALVERLAALLPAKGASARATAIGLVALMVGGLALARAFRGTELSDEVLRASRALGAAAVRGVKK